MLVMPLINVDSICCSTTCAIFSNYRVYVPADKPVNVPIPLLWKGRIIYKGAPLPPHLKTVNPPFELQTTSISCTSE